MGTWKLGNLGAWELENCNLSGQKITEPLGTKKITQPLWTKKSRNLSGQKKITQSFLGGKIIQPPWTKKVTQPLGTKISYATSQDKKNHGTSGDKKRIMEPLG